ncbi:MAG: plasmid mobilization relaxosome protein MobC [Pseudomonadota bacterium]
MFADQIPEYRKSPVKKPRIAAEDQKVIAQLLAAFGQSRISQNLNQIAKAANMGALPVSPELEAELQQACADIQYMRSELVCALGLKSGVKP